MKELDLNTLSSRLDAIEALLKKVIDFVNPSLLPRDADNSFPELPPEDPEDFDGLE